MTEKFVTDIALNKILADFPKKKNSAYNLDFNQIASYIIGYGSIAQRPFASQERMNAVFVEKAVISSSVTVHRLWQCIAKNWVMIASTDVVKLIGFTVDTLPNGTVGDVVMVTDQLTAPAAKGVAPTGGGDINCAVFFNGTIWVGI